LQNIFPKNLFELILTNQLMKKAFFLFFILVSIFNSFGQTWTNYTEDNTSVPTMAITIDSLGIKWFGTSKGVTKFDGTTWTNYNTTNGLANNFVSAIAIDPKGNKWFGTEKGVSVYNDTSWTTYNTSNGLVNNKVYSIAFDSLGNAWIGTYGGLSKFDGVNWVNYTTFNGLVSNHVRAIGIDALGNKWIGTPDGISKFDGTTFTTYNTKNTKNLASDRINAITIAYHGYVVYFATSFGVTITDCYGDDWGSYQSSDSNHDVLSIAIDSDGYFWAGLDKGAGLYKSLSTRFYNTIGYTIYAIAIDKQGNKWLGTDHGIVLKYDGTNLTPYNLHYGLADGDINAVAIDAQNNKWFGAGFKGVSKFDDTNWRTYTVTDGLANDYVFAISIDSKGNKWIGTRGGVSEFDGSSWTTYTKSNGLIGNSITSIFADSKGNIWVGCNEVGLSKFDGSNWKTYGLIDGLPNCYPTVINEDAQGNIWIGTWGGGVSKFDGTNFTNYKKANGLAHDCVLSIGFDASGNKWFGTKDGVSKFDGTHWTTYLSGKTINAIAVDKVGNMWFGTGGVSKFDGTNWTTYTEKDGLLYNLVYSIAIDAQGNKWFGTREGVSKFSDMLEQPMKPTGEVNLCEDSSYKTYKTRRTKDALSYSWTLSPLSAGTISGSDTIATVYWYSNFTGAAKIKVRGISSNSIGPNSDSLTIFIGAKPIAAGNITDTTFIGQQLDSVRYTVPTIANATSYIWTLPTGATDTTISNSITVNHETSLVPGDISVKGHNDCGNGVASYRTVNVYPLPVIPGFITGSRSVCQGQDSVTYSVSEILYATSYIWTLPSGATGVSSTNSIILNYSNSAVSGNLTVKGHNQYGDGPPSVWPINVYQHPKNAGAITGKTTVCQGQFSVTYSVPAIEGATSYIWSFPTGAYGISDTNSIIVDYAKSAVSGNISVKGHSECGDGTASTLAITVNQQPATAGIISGATSVCPGEDSISYTVPAIENATSYSWSLPTGATGISSTNSITVNYALSSKSGNIAVKGHNDCGDGVASTLTITVNRQPATAGVISGATSVCPGEDSITYTVPAIDNATSYSWSLPTGATGISSTNSITVNYALSSKSGNIAVKGHSDCGDGVASTLAITVNRQPATAGVISGATSVCPGEDSITYTVPAIENATSYSWSIPTGATGISSTNSITVNYAMSSKSGNIAVKGHNNCGDGEISTLAVSVNPLPEIPIISIKSDTLTSSAELNQWFENGVAIVGATNKQFILNKSGNYSVTAYNEQGCSISSQPVFINYTDVQLIGSFDFMVYPNPNNGQFTIELSNVKSAVGVSIFNLLGARVYNSETANLAGQKINLTGIRKGIYFLKVTDGKDSFTRKIVVN
jgi:ligand-binding sensor domain-containing protein